MIGEFYYAAGGESRAVTVLMQWRDGRRTGRIVLATELAQALDAQALPAYADDDLGLETALSYALFIAMQAETPLVLSGDRSVWKASWGTLTHMADNDSAATGNLLRRH